MIVTDVFSFDTVAEDIWDKQLDIHMHSRQGQDKFKFKDIKVLDSETIIIIWEKND